LAECDSIFKCVFAKPFITDYGQFLDIGDHGGTAKGCQAKSQEGEKKSCDGRFVAQKKIPASELNPAVVLLLTVFAQALQAVNH